MYPLSGPSHERLNPHLKNSRSACELSAMHCVISFPIRNVRGVKMLIGEISWNYLFSLQQQREFTFLFPIKIAKTYFGSKYFWDDIKFTGKSQTGIINAVEHLANQRHQIWNTGVCAVVSGQRERFWILTKRCSWRFTYKKDDIREDWGSDYWFNHLGNAWNIDVRTGKPRRIPPSPSWSVWWWIEREKQLERKIKIGNCSCP